MRKLIGEINHNEDRGARVKLYVIDEPGEGEGAIDYLVYSQSGEDCGLGRMASVAECRIAMRAAWGDPGWALVEK